jgi:hypothetical protein
VVAKLENPAALDSRTEKTTHILCPGRHIQHQSPREIPNKSSNSLTLGAFRPRTAKNAAIFSKSAKIGDSLWPCLRKCAYIPRV